MRPFKKITAAVAAGAFFLLAGCSGQSGPLRSLTEDGQLVIDGGGSLVTPGESADTTAYVVNSGTSPVTLESVSVVAVKGYPIGHLTHVAVIVGKDTIGGARGWPPAVPTRPFKGAVIGPGRTNIVVGVNGPVAGRTYMAAGLKIVYRSQGSASSMIAWVVISACVVDDVKRSSPASCSRANQRAITKVKQQAG
jgi:hypothetical protein